MNNEEWRPFTWYCLNCTTKVIGYKNSNGDIKVQCTGCGAVMVRKIKSRTHDTIDVFAPPGLEHV